MTLPIALLGLIGQYMNNGLASWISDLGLIILFVSVIISFILMIITGLYLQPAFYRAIQKNEMQKGFNIKESYNTQLKNLWNFFMLMIWILLYTIWIIRYYIIAGLLLGIIAMIFKGQLGAILMSVSVLILAVGAIINMPKLILYQNIFFAKDNIKPRDAARESIELGKQKTSDIWKVIFSMIVFGLLILLVYVIATAILIVPGFISLTTFVMIADGILAPTITYIIAYIVSFVFSVFFVNPMIFIMLAKAYVKLSNNNTSTVIEDVKTEEIIEAEIIAPQTQTGDIV